MIEYLINDADRIGYHHRKTEVITRLHRYKNKSKKKSRRIKDLDEKEQNKMITFLEENL